MYSFFVNKLTESTGNMLDFSRGFDFSRSINSVKTGTLKYTSKEAIIRVSMLILTAAGGYLGNHLNSQDNDEEPPLSPALAIIIGATAGLTVGHIPVVYGIIEKRKKMKAECSALIDEIETIAKKLDVSSDLVKSVTDDILNYSLANTNSSNASQTLGRRNRFLDELKNVLKEQKDMDSAEAFLKHLKSGNNIESIFKNEVSLASIVDTSTVVHFKK